MSRRTQLSVMPLENREVPATITLRSGVLSIVGTSANDRVEVSMFLGMMSIRDTSDPIPRTTTFDATPVQRIVFRGHGGNDHFTNDSNRPSRAFGGAGNDTLLGGMSKDVLNGDAGDDRLLANGGSDTLNGGLGSDTMMGGAGDDRMNGGAQRDLIYGDDGDDRLAGGADNDILYGDKGEDTLFGGYGDDTLFGDGDGLIDVLYGNAGRDTFARYNVGFWILASVETDNEKDRGVIDRWITTSPGSS